MLSLWGKVVRPKEQSVDLTVAVALNTAGATLTAGFGAVVLTTWFQHREQKAAAKRRLVAMVDTAVTKLRRASDPRRP